MESHELSRYFEFNGVRLPDINSSLSVEEIRAAVRPPISRYRYGNNHRAGGSRRQAAVSVLTSRRFKGVTL